MEPSDTKTEQSQRSTPQILHPTTPLYNPPKNREEITSLLTSEEEAQDNSTTSARRSNRRPPPHSFPQIDPLLFPAEVAVKLGVALETLAVWRSTKRYPQLQYVKVGRSVRYRREAVEAFLNERTV